MVHHTHPPAGGWEIKVPTMRWKWRGRGNEDEVKMTMRWKILNQDQRGERKRRGKEQTPTHENLAQTGNPGKAREKKSGGRRKTEQDQRRRGKTEAPEPTWHGENATGQTYLEKGERKNTWNRDPWGTSLWHHASKLSCKFPLVRLYGLHSRQPYRRLSVFRWIPCTIEPHRETKKKWPHL